MQQSSRFIRELVSRRRFLAATAGLAACAAGRLPKAPDALRVAGIGIGGRGWDDLQAVDAAGARIVALCDCDARQTDAAFKEFPDATRYTDWRRMLEREKDYRRGCRRDARSLTTPIVAIAAMKHGKHVYCEKPLAHSIWEAREMARVATRDRAGHADGDAGTRVRGHAPRRRSHSRAARLAR